MVRTAACIALLVIFTSFALGQSADKSLKFESADVHSSPPSQFAQMAGGVLRAGRYEIRSASMVDLIRTAYGVEAEKVVGGPGWVDSDRFDVLAKAPTGANAETAKVMLQNLLADRFSLKTHNDSKPLPVYVLTIAKGGSKLKPSSGKTGCEPVPQPPPTPGVIPYQVAACHGATAAEIGEDLRMIAGGYVDHPVIDQTKLEGTWDFELKWTARGALAAAGPDGISLFDAVEKQLGLKLEAQKIAMPVIVVDSVNPKPTDNLPGVGSNAPEAPVEFEAAEIKPSEPGSQGINIRYTNGGRIDAMGSLRDLIGIAYEVLPNLAPDTIVGYPKFAETARYNILAKAPSTGIGAPDRTGGRETPPPIAVALQMLRNLLEDRFSLKTHKDLQKGTGYAIVIPKGESKLKKADPSERANCRPDPGATPANASGLPMNTITCTNTTMADLAKNVAQWAGAYIDHPVVDMTGLQGGWNFSLSWTPRGALQGNGPEPNQGPGGTAAAALPGGVSVFEAFEKQLGLKLDKQTLMIPVIVVDHVAEKPKD